MTPEEFENDLYNEIDKFIYKLSCGELLTFSNLSFSVHSAKYNSAIKLMESYYLVKRENQSSSTSIVTLMQEGRTASKFKGGIREYIAFKERRIPFVSIEYLIQNYGDVIASAQGKENTVANVEKNEGILDQSKNMAANDVIKTTIQEINKSEAEKPKKWYEKITFEAIKTILLESLKYIIPLIIGYVIAVYKQHK